MKNAEHVPPKVKRFLSKKASEYPAIERVLLFGSRARQDAGDRSDFDLAVIAPRIERENWSRFALDIEEHLPTLCGVDLLLVSDKTDPALRARIGVEGIVIYERLAA